ncbi:MAG: hypothetical protein ISR82_06760 [Candidatus Marinimicrobia bacterium]|nr:hypothetical protein [Candidatus Neomarinimicrobiota bacterium]
MNENILDGFKRFLGGYSLAINKQQNRHGSLMQKRFKRIVIESDNYLLSLIHYIHHNPIHHGLTDSFLRLGTIHRTIQLYHRDKQRLREKNS